jgi:SAM-dependent methyltransferase
MKKIIMLAIVFFPCLLISNSNSEIFSKIYENNIWGNGSGAGSKLENCLEYIDFLNRFLRKNKISSVVDLGCGDWQFSYKIDWENIEYLGLDCVEDLVQTNQKIFGKDNINFKMMDCVNEQLPKADLLISKDCLQHLSLESIKKIVKQFGNYKYCLITNDINFRAKLNRDIVNGDYRCLDLTKPPFCIKGSKVLQWRCDDHGVIKACYLFKNF